MNKTQQVIKYLFADFISASLAWTLLYAFRKLYIEKFDQIQIGEAFFYGLLFIPLFWLTLYAVTGQYNRIYRRHRLKEVSQVLWLSVFGSIIIFFAFLLDDQITTYKDYYQSLLVLFGTHFSITLFFRIILTSRTVRRIHKGVLGFNTVVVGGYERGVSMYEEIAQLKKSPGFRFLGFVQVNGTDTALAKHLPNLGTVENLRHIIEHKKVEEILIAVGSSDHGHIEPVLNIADATGVNVKIIPDMYDILSGSVKMNSIFGTPLIQINKEIMPAWQFSLKRIFDIVGSFFAVLLLMPVYIVIGVCIALNSKGPVFFLQERVGLYGKPFKIIKFRSMVCDAEKNGPQLSSTNDARITKVGLFLRKTRLDEIPQFLNVLKGDMSLVGPRPERQHYIEEITKKAPHYRHLHKVRPGITSWGQVKFGYAENVDQMIQRLKYDVLYIENMSLAVDIKILLYTILIVFRGDGK